MNKHSEVPANCFDGIFPSSSESDELVPNPKLNSRSYLIDGTILEFDGEISPVFSPICSKSSGTIQIGSIPMLTEAEAIRAVEAARKAFADGRGIWPSSPVKLRIAAVEKFMQGVKSLREELVNILMWEICKPRKAAEKEVDRTLKYVQDTIVEYKRLVNQESLLVHGDSEYVAKIRRVPLGVVLCSSPTNYPLNELYTTLIPAILMGNTVVLKIPRIGGLCHFPTLELFRDCFPPGVVNVLPGSGRSVMQPIMASGLVDAFAFIGSTHAAQDLLKSHPKPNRLRLCLGLEAKNPAIVFSDAKLDEAVSEIVSGALSFNGMRCTAIKIIYVQESVIDVFLEKLIAKVDALNIGLPWDSSADITPLAERNKVQFLNSLVDDAVAKGANIMTKRFLYDRTIYSPTVLYPVNDKMRIYTEEQFGPLVPVTTFKDVELVFSDLARSNFGQQASVFTQDPEKLSHSIDVLTQLVSRVNVNSQCQRGPDLFPFTARKDSATATLSVHDALRTFSIRAMVAIKETANNHDMIKKVTQRGDSEFMSVDYLM